MECKTHPEASFPAGRPVLANMSVVPSQSSHRQQLTWFRSGQTTSLLASVTEKELVREARGGIALQAPLPDTAGDPARRAVCELHER